MEGLVQAPVLPTTLELD